MTDALSPADALELPELSGIQRVITTALDEDLCLGPDVTTLATVPADSVISAAIRTREAGVVCGLPLIDLVLAHVLPEGGYEVSLECPEGSAVSPGQVVARISAPTAALLTAERTILNLMTHLSGISTITHQWVAAVAETSCLIRDTRKTLPGLRDLEKYAVRAGGGRNHRMALGDAALIKDNHIVAAGGVVPALEAVKEQYPTIPTEVEVDSLDQLREVLNAGVELVLLDNMSVDTTREAVALRNELAPSTALESSGGLSLEVAADYAQTGVDYLAVGALTHSVKVLDLGLDM